MDSTLRGIPDLSFRIVRDKVDPDAVHKAFLGLKEYYDGCSDDMPGVRR